MKRRSRCSRAFASLSAGIARKNWSPRLVRVIAYAPPRLPVRALARQRKADPPHAEEIGVVEALPVAEQVKQARGRQHPQRAGCEKRDRPDEQFENEAVERDPQDHGVARHSLIERVFALHRQPRISSTISTAPKTTTMPMMEYSALRLSIIPYFIRYPSAAIVMTAEATAH